MNIETKGITHELKGRIMTKPNSKPKKEDQQKSGQPQYESQEINVSQLFSDVNVTMKSGHLTRDAETVGNGTKYAKLRIASNKQYEAPDGEIKTNTNYFDVMVSSNLSEAFELAKSFKKGDWIYCKGEDSTRSFDTPEGYKKTASTIFAYHVVKKIKGNAQEQNDTPVETHNHQEAVTPS